MKRFIQKMDYLSPSIALYHSGSIRHNSIFSGVLTLLYCSVMISIVVFYSSEILTHRRLSSSYHKTYLDDPGEFEVSSKSFFHYLTFKNGFQFDSRAMSVIGAERRPSAILKNNKEVSFDHWIYSNCTLNLKPKNSKNFNGDNFGLCISGFYDSKLRRVFKESEEGFRYPVIQHGMGNDNSQPYSVIVQACQNETKDDTCFPEEEIKNYFGDLFSMVMHIQDFYVDIKSYTYPFITNLNAFEVGIFQDMIVASSMHFSSTILNTYEGYVSNSLRSTTGYSYDQVVKNTYEPNTKDQIYSMFFFWMNNQAHVYERNYSKIQDILPEITAISKLSYTVLFLINMLFHNYIVFFNFNNLVFGLQKEYKFDKINTFNLNQTLSRTRTKLVQSITEKGLSLKCPQERINFRKEKFSLIAIFHLIFRIKSCYMKKLLKLRKKLLSEDRIIKNYIVLNDLVAISNCHFQPNVQALGDKSLLGSVANDSSQNIDKNSSKTLMNCYFKTYFNRQSSFQL